MQLLQKPLRMVGLGLTMLVALAAFNVLIPGTATAGRTLSAWRAWLVWLALLAGGVTIIIGSVVALRQWMPQFRQWRIRKKTLQRARPSSPSAAAGSPIDTTIREATQRLTRSPVLKEVGWYLLLGESQSGKTTLLRSLEPLLPSFAPLLIGPHVSVGFFNEAVVLDTAISYRPAPENAQPSTQWLELMQALRRYHKPLPLNGLVITLGAHTLLETDRHQGLLQNALALRQGIDDLMQELGATFPIYLLITRCDTMAGFTEFFGYFPDKLKQVFGHICELPHNTQGPPPDPQMLFQTIAASLVQQLRQLRLAIFNETSLPAAPLHQHIFCFPEEFCRLLKPLEEFVTKLLQPNRASPPLPFRGLFFCSAQPAGERHSLLRQELHFPVPAEPTGNVSTSFFLHDLFAEILPRDQYIARQTGWGLLRQLGWKSFCIAGLLILGGLMIFPVQAFLHDRRTAAAVDQAVCGPAAGGPASLEVFLGRLERCRQVVQDLSAVNAQRFVLSKLLLTQSVQREEQLRHDYTQKFASELLSMLDVSLEQRLQNHAEATEVAFTLTRRIELLKQCVSAAGCAETTTADPQLYSQALLRLPGQAPPPPQHLAKFQELDALYLQWGMTTEEVLQQEQENHVGRLQRVFASSQFTLQQIETWLNPRYAAISSRQYWEDKGPLGGKKSGQVDGAYTTAAWSQSFVPFIRSTREAVPTSGQRLQELQEQYRTQYLEQWQRFLSDFPRSVESLPRDQRRLLATTFLEERSPYQRILDTTVENLRPFLAAPTTAPLPSAPGAPAAGFFQRLWHTISPAPGTQETPPQPEAIISLAGPGVPDWVPLFQRASGSESRKAYRDALKPMRELFAKNASAEKLFLLAKGGFQEGTASVQSAHPILKARGIIEQWRDQEGPVSGADKVFWPLLEQPLRFLWKATIDEAREFLQQSWEDTVIAPTAQLPEQAKLETLYGPRGKIREFTEQFAKPFLAENETRVGQALGEKAPLADGFLKVLKDEKVLAPKLEQAKVEPPLIKIAAGAKSEPKSETKVVEERTEFAIDCQPKPFKITNRMQEPQDVNAVSIPWPSGNCSDATISIFLTCDRQCAERAAIVGITVTAAPLRLTKRYPGRDALQNFIKDFRSGTREFSLHDFADDPPSQESMRAYRIDKLKVTYRVDAREMEQLTTLIPTPLLPPSILK